MPRSLSSTHARPRAAGSAGLRRDAARGGFTLIEAAITIIVLAVAALAVLSSMTYALRLFATNKETAAASQAARRRLELIKTEAVTDVVALYNADAADDPGGSGTAPGPTFAVAGLTAVTGSADDPGSVLLPLNAAGELREDLDLAELGMPRDLNGDGLIDSLDHRADVAILPVLVRVTWNGVDGERTLFYTTVLR